MEIENKLARPVSNGKGGLMGWMIFCPACGHGHLFNTDPANGKPRWTFNGNESKPTFSPSMLSRCTMGEEHKPHVCHSFVRDGRIEYLSDCTHAMAGKTVDLEPF